MYGSNGVDISDGSLSSVVELKICVTAAGKSK